MDIVEQLRSVCETGAQPEIIDSAIEEIEKLRAALRWYVETDEVYEGDPDNKFWIDGKHSAMKILGMK